MEFENISIPWKGWTAKKNIGEGYFGTVYMIERTQSGITDSAALKVVRIPKTASEYKRVAREKGSDEEARKHFGKKKDQIISEIKILREFKGTGNFVSIEDWTIGELEDRFGWELLIRMELLTPLDDKLLEIKTLPEEEVVKLGKDICTALTRCEKKGVIHRDIKPENILISQHGDYKLGDFGISRHLEDITTMTDTLGTKPYLAPEVIKYEKPGKSIDTYSLGIVMYELLNNNRQPFLDSEGDPTQLDKVRALQSRLDGKKMPEPANGSDELKRIVLKACEYRPSDRYKNAGEMLSDLRQLAGIIEAEPQAAERPDIKSSRTNTDSETVIKVIGVGNGGCNTINSMINAGVRGVTFIGANTDKKSLSKCRADIRIQLGEKAAGGRGTGADPETGRIAAEESLDEIVSHVRDADVVFITAGMGGGAGTGAAPVIAKASRDCGAFTAAVVTKPFEFEGKKRVNRAEKGILELSNNADSLVVIPNDRLIGSDEKKVSRPEAYAMFDDVLVQCIDEYVKGLEAGAGIIRDEQSSTPAGKGSKYSDLIPALMENEIKRAKDFIAKDRSSGSEKISAAIEMPEEEPEPERKSIFFELGAGTYDPYKRKTEDPGKFCRFCGSRIPDKGIFCPACGSRKQVPANGSTIIYCSKCGNVVPEGAYFCSECGALVRNTEKQESGFGSEFVSEVPERKKAEAFTFDWSAVVDESREKKIPEDINTEMTPPVPMKVPPVIVPVELKSSTDVSPWDGPQTTVYPPLDDPDDEIGALKKRLENLLGSEIEIAPEDTYMDMPEPEPVFEEPKYEDPIFSETAEWGNDFKDDVEDQYFDLDTARETSAVDEAAPAEASKEEKSSGALTLEELEKEVFGEPPIAETGPKGGKFASLYRKNEEFQRLLDEEYPKLKAESACIVPAPAEEPDTAKPSEDEAEETKKIDKSRTLNKKSVQNLKKILITIITIIFVFILGTILVLQFAPESSAALFIDSLIESLAGEPDIEEEEEKPEPIEPVDGSEAEDKTEDQTAATVPVGPEIDSSLCGFAFEILGRTYSDLEQEFGPFSEPLGWDGAYFYRTADDKLFGFTKNEIASAGSDPGNVPCTSYFAKKVSDVFDVPDDISLQELSDKMGVEFDAGSVSYTGDSYNDIVVWYFTYNGEQYKAVLSYDEDLNVSDDYILLVFEHLIHY